jgi:hypothetical protein
MNVEGTNVASTAWEHLLSEICEGRFLSLRLFDSQTELYCFSNAILMRRMQERLVEALQSH